MCSCPNAYGLDRRVCGQYHCHAVKFDQLKREKIYRYRYIIRKPIKIPDSASFVLYRLCASSLVKQAAAALSVTSMTFSRYSFGVLVPAPPVNLWCRQCTVYLHCKIRNIYQAFSKAFCTVYHFTVAKVALLLPVWSSVHGDSIICTLFIPQATKIKRCGFTHLFIIYLFY